MKHIGQNPLVSVIIPAYNQGPMLERAIESALAQTYQHIELVVVNDGSPSSITFETVQRYLSHVVYIERDNGGVAAARNTGIAAASGELIALLDQDDIWLPHRLATEVKVLNDHPEVAMVHSSYYIIDASGERTGVARLPHGPWTPLPDLLLEVPIASCTTLFPRSLHDELGMFDPALAGSDDWDLWLRMAAQGYRFFNVGEPLAEYRIHAANTSRDADLMVRAGLGALDKFYNLPNLPGPALRCKDRAYFNRYVWAMGMYYGVGRLDKALESMRLAARCYPRGIATGRFLQSLIHSSPGGASPQAAREALRFVLNGLSADLPPHLLRKLRSRARLVLGLHAGSDGLAMGVVRALAADPLLAADRELWAVAWRMAGRLGEKLNRKARRR